MKKSNRLYTYLQIYIALFCMSISFSLNAQCDFYGSINVSASAFETSNTQQYVLVNDNSGTPSTIQDISTSGNFTSVAAGNYWIYAVNYEGSQPTELAASSNWSGVVSFDANIANCIELSSAYLNRAISVCDILEVCEPDDISVSTSNENTSGFYTQTFVLVDNSNQILESNTSGTFTVTDYVSDGNFFVYAVNTDENTVNDEIDDKGTWADVSAMQGGFLCLDVIVIPVTVTDIGICNSTLPVELLSFKGEALDETNLITWETATEINNDYFELQVSENGTNFNTIYKVSGAGNSSQKINYNYKHNNPFSLTYYRLKQTDFDGTQTTSKTISINRKKSSNNSISVYPTLLSSSHLNIDFSSESNMDIKIEIENILGQKISSFEESVFEGENKLNLNIDIQNACYFVNIYFNDESFMQKIIIDK